uniref:Rab-GAP TBC domain-containing protein n=1 Tax=Bursaphelenchus xylophilus TaxID=6326 RepID=A0A1I7RUT5_BURXY
MGYQQEAEQDCHSNRVNAQSARISFFEEWKYLFRNAELDADTLRNHCFAGHLRDSNLRSVVWRVLLKVLPYERLEWRRILADRRRDYSELKRRLNTNPRAEKFGDDPNLNNPLSQKDENPWNQFFIDEGLRDSIRKDVDRTFPELQFFQSQTTKRIMSDILFVYSKQNSHISYRQGMHEILAPILFVIYFDHRSFEHLNEQNALGGFTDFELDTLSCVNDPDYLEHDAYTLFQQVMFLLEGFYANTDLEEDCDMETGRKENLVPFQGPDCPHMHSQLLKRLTQIHEELLPQVDSLLYRHLHSLDISPQLYGIRWLRLLFGREFPLHDLLYLWDVLFADSPILGLCEQVFLALLVQIRHLLLCGDYSSTLQYLMRYPPTADIHIFVQLVLHLKEPKKHPKPKNLSLYSHMTLAGKAHPNQDRSVYRFTNGFNGVSKPKMRANQVLSKLARPALSANSTPLLKRPENGLEAEMVPLKIAVPMDTVRISTQCV